MDLDYSSSFLIPRAEVLALGIDSDSVSLFQKMKYRKAYGLPTWYEKLSTANTFRTISYSLSYEEAFSLYKYNTESIEPDENLISLKLKIDEILKQSFPGGAFIKLDTRSPKDVPFYKFYSDKPDEECEYFIHILNEELEKVNEPTPNNRVLAFYLACSKYLKVESGEKVMYLLKKSDRVRQDLNEVLRFGKKFFEGAIIFREWDERVTEMRWSEFRGFVHKNKLNAVTQYMSDLFFPQVFENREEIELRIKEYFDKIKLLLPHENYVIDFILFPNEIKVIELNPFHTETGAGLFSWTKDRDRFFNGPFELRVQTKPMADPYQLIYSRWVDYMDNFYKNKFKRRCVIQ